MMNRLHAIGGIICVSCVVISAAVAAPTHSPSPSPTSSSRSTALEMELDRIRSTPAGLERSLNEARLLYYLAQATEDSAAKREFLLRGKSVTEEAKVVNPDSSAALFWWVGHVASLADIDRGVSALRSIRKVEEELLRLKKMDPSYEYAAADRVLGRIYQKAPRFISIGSSSKAEFHLKLALERYPDYPGNQLFYAEYLYEDGEYAKALKYAAMVLENPKLSLFPWESTDWLAAARRIQADAGAKLTKE
jgi:tetratricopeptide (TPR) repeat protein